MMKHDAKTNRGQTQPSVNMGKFEASVKRSDSGQMSVSIGDISKTESFKRDLETLGRIRQLIKTNNAQRR